MSMSAAMPTIPPPAVTSEVSFQPELRINDKTRSQSVSDRLLH